MPSLFRSSVTLFAGAGLFVLANGILTTVVSLVARQESFSAVAIAWVLASYSIGMTIGACVQGQMVRQFGHIRVFAGMSALLVNAALMLSMWRHPVVWFGVRMIVGFSIAGLFVVIESWVSERATPSTRGVLLSVYTIVCQSALALGQFLLFSVSLRENTIFLVVAAIYALALLPIVFTPVGQPSVPREATMGLGALWRLTPTGFIGSVVSGVVAGSLMSMGPLFASEVLRSQADLSYFMTALLLSGLLLQWPMGWLSDRMPRDVVLIGLGVGLVCVCLWACVVPLASLGYMVALGIALGALGFVLYPVSLALANDLVTREQMVAVTGTILIVYGFGAIAGPFVGTFLLEGLGPYGFLLWIGLSGVFLACFASLRLFVRPPMPLEAQGEFAPITLPSAVAGHELEPWFERQLSFSFFLEEKPSNGHREDPGGGLVTQEPQVESHTYVSDKRPGLLWKP